MEWTIYIILRFIYWRYFPFFSLIYIAIVSTFFCWYYVSEVEDKEEMSVGGE